MNSFHVHTGKAHMYYVSVKISATGNYVDENENATAHSPSHYKKYRVSGKQPQRSLISCFLAVAKKVFQSQKLRATKLLKFNFK